MIHAPKNHEGSNEMKEFLLLAALVLLFPTAAPATDADVLDLTGDWQCLAVGVIRGENLHAEPGEAEHQVRFLELEVEISIDEQKDRRFVGTKTAGGATENIIGIVAADGETALEVDHDGTARWHFHDADSFWLEYVHSWGPGKMSAFDAECARAK
jgi:hypothetical protein